MAGIVDYTPRRFQKRPILDRLTLGYVEDGWQEIDAGGGTAEGYTTHHGSIAKVVIRMGNEERPYEEGVELVKRITAIPDMLAALRSVVQAESLYDAQHRANEILTSLGLKP